MFIKDVFLQVSAAFLDALRWNILKNVSQVYINSKRQSHLKLYSIETRKVLKNMELLFQKYQDPSSKGAILNTVFSNFYKSFRWLQQPWPTS